MLLVGYHGYGTFMYFFLRIYAQRIAVHRA